MFHGQDRHSHALLQGEGGRDVGEILFEALLVEQALPLVRQFLGKLLDLVPDELDLRVPLRLRAVAIQVRDHARRLRQLLIPDLDPLVQQVLPFASNLRVLPCLPRRGALVPSPHRLHRLFAPPLRLRRVPPRPYRVFGRAARHPAVLRASFPLRGRPDLAPPSPLAAQFRVLGRASRYLGLLGAAPRYLHRVPGVRPRAGLDQRLGPYPRGGGGRGGWRGWVVLDRHLRDDAPGTGLRLVLVQQFRGRFQGYGDALRGEGLLVVPVVGVQADEDGVVLAALLLRVEPELDVADAVERGVAGRRWGGVELGGGAGGGDRLVVTFLALAFLEQAQRGGEHALVLRLLSQTFLARGSHPVPRLGPAAQTLGRVLDLGGQATARLGAGRR